MLQLGQLKLKGMSAGFGALERNGRDRNQSRNQSTGDKDVYFREKR